MSLVLLWDNAKAKKLVWDFVEEIFQQIPF